MQHHDERPDQSLAPVHTKDLDGDTGLPPGSPGRREEDPTSPPAHEPPFDVPSVDRPVDEELQDPGFDEDEAEES